jgi:molecular chaperone GrpE
LSTEANAWSAREVLELMSDERDIHDQGDTEETADQSGPAPASGDRPSPPGASEEAVAVEAPAEPPPPSLEEQLEASRAETKAMREKMLRVAADYENYRKRATRQIDEARLRGLQTAVKELLPVFDNLERATVHIDQSTDPTTLADGLNMVRRQLLDTLAKLGIERVPSVGTPFDPTVHESIQHEHSADHPAGTVMTELQPGYRTSGVLLRPALVVVSRGPAAAEAAAPPEPADAEPPAEDDGEQGA